MKKCIIIICLIVTVLSVGCVSQNEYEVFQEAIKKTGAIEKGRSKLNFQLNMKFNEKELPQEIIKKLNNYKNIKVNIDAQFNKKNSCNKFFIETEALGLDTKLYSKEGLKYVVTSLMPKIIIIEDKEKNDPQSLSKEMNKLNSELENTWNNLYNRENVNFVDNTILNTPQGNIEAKEYIVKLNDEQIKAAVCKSIEIFFRNEKIIKEINKIEMSEDKNFNLEEIEIEKEKILNSVQKSFKQFLINDFTQKLYINKDNYIVGENLIIDMKFNNAQPGSPQNINFEMEMKRWDINRDQEIYFPEVNKENSIQLNELKTEQFMN